MASTKAPKRAQTRRKPARRAPLSRERVLATAIELADAEGLEALSMRRLAQALGVEAMSLYNHVKSKEDVLDAMVDLVIGEIEAPAIGGDWKAALRRRAVSAHAVLMRHRWAPQLVVSTLNIGPAMRRYVDATLGCLHAAGFSYAEADHAWNALDSHIYGFTLQALNFPLEPSQYAGAAAQFLHLIPPEQFPHMHALSLLVIDGEHDGLQDFTFGLDLLLDGLERLLGAKKPAV
ncbi:TetR/AcrR family transcriptional regulator [Nannocystis bainbridge]|uniref:TetR/AcrR family transcriptional regulator C-terminal domain-containing protein n=1 Tax=Nannocystis bainbridge TaxID=2995303 RepID=A0ABT5DT50_9BACT|nr:TetR/AcrR family transcriptional regulator C-terminal domain-containing protein [Nannocystis bainbridge]MDC0716817.1 TetR/AcrR family transcriptional regulator C-terminal domain-containing protein [Nannocystis bainbridge]